MIRTVSPFKIILGVSLCTLGATLLYVYFKNRDEEEEQDNQKRKTKKTNASPFSLFNFGQSKKSIPQKEITVQITISNEDIPLIVGRGGTNLSVIEEKTNTSIRFKDKDETHKFCDIRGYPDAVKEVRLLLNKEIERSPIVKEEMLIPQKVFNRIIGRCGETMQEIRRVSLAKVSVDPDEKRNSGVNKHLIIITGNRTQVNVARKLIEDKIQEDEEYRKTIEEIEQKREPRRSPTNSVCSSIYSSQTSLNMHLPSKEKLTANEYEKQMEIYVSAVASPSRFWVQLIGRQSKKLDDLVQEMTEYYGLESNRLMHQVTEPYLGQIVAVIFKFDSKWYRAEIVGILPNQFNSKEIVLDLYFVDYGDSEYVSPTEVFELRTDFLTLRFQAVECFLANIKSNDPNDPDNWDQQAIQKFEEITQVASWKKLIARVVTYSERPKVGSRPTRETSPVPGVELIDSNDDGTEINIGHLLICQGFGLSENQTPSLDSPLPYQQQSTPPPRAQSIENILSNGVSTKEDMFLLQQQLRYMKGSDSAYTNGMTDAVALTSTKAPSNATNLGHSPASVSPVLSNRSPPVPINQHWKENGKLIK